MIGFGKSETGGNFKEGMAGGRHAQPEKQQKSRNHEEAAGNVMVEYVWFALRVWTRRNMEELR